MAIYITGHRSGGARAQIATAARSARRGSAINIFDLWVKPPIYRVMSRHRHWPRLVGRRAILLELSELFSKPRCINYDVIGGLLAIHRSSWKTDVY